ncbi:MAG: MFS transporter [Oscillospiraceae bacterium]|nr:MFS transporter [Oscillospiraceae bacterium]
MNDSRKNAIRSIVAGAARAIAVLCSTGPIMQIFLSNLGFSSRWIYIHTTIVYAANVVTIFLGSQWADSENLIKRTVIVEIPQALLYLCYIPLCIWKSASLASFVMLTAICLLQSVSVALFTVCGYKLPYYMYKPSEYGSVLSVSGLVASTLSLCTGLVISWLRTFLSYSQLMLYACIASAVLILLSALLHWQYKPIVSLDSKPKTNEKKLVIPIESLLRYPLFFNLIPANFFRGFSYGTVSIMATIALDLGLGESISLSLVSVQAVATIIACLGFTVFSSKLSLRAAILVCTLTYLPLPFMLTKSIPVFYFAFAAVILGRTFIEYAVPSLMRYVVPAEIAGPFNGWRMLLHNAGHMSATAIAALIPLEWLLIITTVLQIITGISYYLAKDLRQADTIHKANYLPKG